MFDYYENYRDIQVYLDILKSILIDFIHDDSPILLFLSMVLYFPYSLLPFFSVSAAIVASGRFTLEFYYPN